MEWWSLFRKVRLVVFAFIAVVSLIWAIILSIYLSKEWEYFTTSQRTIVLAQISVNGVTSLLLYLMIVVVFRVWMELLRMVFLLVIHVGTAVPFTLFGAGFSCKIFDTQLTCQIVNLAFLATAWSISGLLFGYTIYLCIMSRIPRPFPLITPNDLLGSTPSLSRSSSRSSVNSATRLISEKDRLPTARPRSPASIYSQHSTRSRTVPKRLFVTNNGGDPQVNEVMGGVRREYHPRRGLSYGAMGMPTRPPPQSRFSGSTISRTPSLTTSPPKAVSPARSFESGQLSRQTSAVGSVRSEGMYATASRIPPRPLLLNANPFMDPVSRHGTPETATTAWSFTSAPANLNLGHMAPYNPSNVGYDNFLTPYYTFPGSFVPPQLQPGRPRNPFSSLNGGGAYPSTDPYVTYAQSPLGPPARHTATPSNASIHSVTPSLHFTDGYAPHQGAPPYVSNPGQRLDLPPTAHFRAASDPVWRPYSAGARIGYAPGNVELPNPYNRGAEIRRYGSVPHVRSGSYSGYESENLGGYGYYAAGPGYGARVHEGGIARGVAAANDPRWREMVMRAATA